MADPIIGIDLGTTNSEVALIRDRQPHVFAEEGDPILPSFVGLSEDGRLLVGKPAKNQWVLAPERTVKSIKRKMGQDVKVKLGDQEYRPQEMSATASRRSTASTCGPAWSPRPACSARRRPPSDIFPSTPSRGSRKSSWAKRTARRCILRWKSAAKSTKR